MSGKRGRDNGERFADLVDDVVPMEDDRTHVPETRKPAPGCHSDTGAQGGSQRFLRDAGPGAGRADDASRRKVSELRRGDYPPEREVDLHGLRRDAAKRALLQGLEAALAARERCLLVIHGVGKRSPDGPVLKHALPDWVEQSPVAHRIIAYGPASQNLGGEGATLILLRRQRI